MEYSWYCESIYTTISWWRHHMETFPRYWPFLRWIPLTKASDAELWCFLWSAPWINGWVNNREAGDLRRHHAHYDVIVMVATKLQQHLKYEDDIHKVNSAPSKFKICRAEEIGFGNLTTDISHYDVMAWKRFPHFWSFVGRIHQWPMGSLHK